MDDFFDDFDDDFGEEGFTDDEYDENSVVEDSFEDDLESEGEITKDEPCDDKFTAKDAFILGGAMGFAYEEGLRERKRRKRKKFSDD